MTTNHNRGKRKRLTFTTRPQAWASLFMRYNSIHGVFPSTIGALVFGFLGLFVNQTATAEDTLTAEAGARANQWTLSYAGKPVMVYVFDPQKFKPYVQVLNTPDGYGVLRDSPGDHLHHHGLMYAIRVNGINFWEETKGCGVEKVVETSPPKLLHSAAGLPQARLVQVLHWLAAEDAFLPNSNAPPLLIEHRTLTLTLDPEKRETALHWKSQFEVGGRDVTLAGANYNGLGMRFLEELDALAVHLAPQGPLDFTDGKPIGKQIISTVPWEAVVFDLPGKPATIALFGDPANARGDSHFFAMKTPFAYLSATQGLDREPLVYRQGEHFELNYLVTVYSQVKSAAALDERNRQWILHRVN
jgi:hypothetical protein